ncbi:MAG TPA: hypothetical protein VIZ18_01170 [Ktedonobacteraceae bacterium]
MQTKSKQIRDLLGMYQMDPDWTLPSKIDDNLLAWMHATLHEKFRRKRSAKD